MFARLFVVALLLVSYAAIATDDVSRVKDAPVISVAWKKLSVEDAHAVCLEHGRASCSIMVNQVCYIYAPDVRSLQYLFGRSFMECLNGETTAKSPALDAPVETFHYMLTKWDDVDPICSIAETEHMQYRFITDSFSINRRNEGVGSKSGSWIRGCMLQGEDKQKYLVMPIPTNNVLEDLDTVGHEIKHVFDGSWHDKFGQSKPGVFLN